MPAWSPLLKYLVENFDHPTDVMIPKKYLKNPRSFQLYHVWQEQTSDEYTKYLTNGNILQVVDEKGCKRNVRVREKFFYLSSKDIAEFLEEFNINKPKLGYYVDENGVIVID